jgi:hypothetical protein
MHNKQFVSHAREKGVDYFFEKPLKPDKLKELRELIWPQEDEDQNNNQPPTIS